MGLTKYLGVKSKREQNVELFEKQVKGKSKSEVRDLERKLLKPEPIPIYADEPSKFNIKKECSFKVVFGSLEEVELVKKYFYISKYVEPSIGDMSLLIVLLKSLESGEIIYDKKNGRLIHGGKQQRKNDRRNR